MESWQWAILYRGRGGSRSAGEQPIDRSRRSSLKMIFDNQFDHEYNSRPLATDRVLTGKTLMV
jgi:hypothetical protein